MHLTQVVVAKLGPFSTQLNLSIDRQVTILTGANDAGKTSLLRAIRMLLRQEPASEQDVNRDHVLSGSNPWPNDSSYFLEGHFSLTDPAEIIGLNKAKRAISGVLRRTPAPNLNTPSFRLSDGTSTWGSEQGVHFHLPTCIAVGFDDTNESIRSLVPLDKPNSLETSLFQIAFAGKFNLETLRALSVDTWEERISTAEDTLNEQARRVLPQSDYFRFRFRSVDDARTKLAVSIRDAQQATTPFDFRGNGARKMVTILARLLVEGKGGMHRIVLIDEPENSLHADAQHLLREFLFDLCKDGRTQVIYSTHSPCMLNSLRPGQVRLLERKRADTGATTVITPRPESLGFAAVRSSWGLTAVDSLLYGPVTVIVEGATEVNCIPLACTKLAAANIAGFEEHERLLGLSHFLDGRGQNHPVVAKLAEAQGTRVVVFLDGDNNAANVRQRLQESVPTAKVILLPEGKEFEDLVPLNRYFEALALEMDVGDQNPPLQQRYESWVAENPQTSRYAFSKRVGRWLEAEFPEKEAIVGKRKPEIMWKALDLTPANEIAADSFRNLLDAIRQHLSTTSLAR